MGRRFCPRGHDTEQTGRYPSNQGCIVCIKERAARWVLEKPEARKAAYTKYNRKRARNSCRRCGGERAYWYRGVYCFACKSRARQESNARYRERNRLSYNERKLSRLRKLTGLTPKELEIVRAYYGPACVYCGQEASGFDHLQPLAKGGVHTLENLAPCCKSCNSKKGIRLLWAMF